ncbi:MAG TPA: NACHT domain-containing protein [Ktedonobacteraceae bacterium]|nr:NACHT domain-containing protein [Ktedonobacteraceae bacterium]
MRNPSSSSSHWLAPLLSAVAWLRMRIHWMIFLPKRKYRRYMRDQYRYLDIKGPGPQSTFTLALHQIFVEPSIVPVPAHQNSIGPLQTPSLFSTGKHAIWSYLAFQPLQAAHFALIAASGCGKTTLLKHIVFTLLHKNARPPATKIPSALPLLLFLPDHAESIAESYKQQAHFWLEDVVQEQLKQQGKRTLSAGWIHHQLRKGKCLVLLDGLDEIADGEEHRQVIVWLQQQIGAYGNNRFLITSRPAYQAGLLALSGKMVPLKLEPFALEHVERFVHQWYLASEVMIARKHDPKVLLIAHSRAESLLLSIRTTPTLFALAAQPLLLTMMAIVQRYRKTLPDRRVLLYAQACQVFLNRCQESSENEQELTVEQQCRVLEHLAYQMMERQVQSVSLEDAGQAIALALTQINANVSPTSFLAAISNNTGLLLESVQGMLSFPHLTFQEYLAATYIKNEYLEEKLLAHIAQSWWRETARLYSAQADASAIVAACLVSNPPVAALSLAVESCKEAFAIEPTVSNQLEASLIRHLEDPDLERRQLVAEALLERRLQRMIHLHDDTYIAVTLITNAEYQFFLYQQIARGNFYQPDHWCGPYFPPYQASAPVSGMRYSDANAFCAWLTARDTNLWHYRLPRENELRYLQEKKRTEITIDANMGHWIGGHRVIIKKVPYQSEQAKQDVQKMLNRDCAPNLVHAMMRVQALMRLHAPGLARARVLNLVRILVRDLDHPLARALTHSLAFDLERAIDRALDLNRTFDLDLTFARSLVTDLDLAFNRAFDRELARALAPNLTRTFARSLAPDFILMLDRIRELALSRTFALSREDAELLRWYVRFSAYTLAQMCRYLSYFLESPQRSSVLRFASARQREKETFERVIEHTLNLYIAFALLEERIQGHSSTWEGILLVKERRRE